MPQIIVKKAFRFAHHGHQVEAFEPADEPVDTTDECAGLAVAEGWASLPAAAHQGNSEGKALDAAPENKDAATQRNAKAAG
jgi:hypothetical protein